jgi:hypothetical protein
MTESAKPLLLIDIDGVLNPHVGPGIEAGPEFEVHAIHNQIVRLNRMHGAWLHSLLAAYDLVWATTWEEDANRLIAPAIGAPDDLPVISFPDRDSLGWTWKLPAVRGYVQNRPAVWLDDDPGEGAEEWAAQRGVPTRLIRPNGYDGWRESELEELWTFVRTSGDGRSSPA